MYDTLKVEFGDFVRRDLVHNINATEMYISYCACVFSLKMDGFCSRNVLLMLVQ
jgi:hypothetical protein